MLSQLRFTVLEAKDGMEALEVFYQHAETIRLVVSDLTMPCMDGDHSEWPQAFLGIPYQVSVLLETIRKALGNK